MEDFNSIAEQTGLTRKLLALLEALMVRCFQFFQEGTFLWPGDPDAYKQIIKERDVALKKENLRKLCR